MTDLIKHETPLARKVRTWSSLRIERATEDSVEKPYIKPHFPMIYDLSSDPHEDNNLILRRSNLRLDSGAEFQAHRCIRRQPKEIPNIKVGEDFKGYTK